MTISKKIEKIHNSQKDFCNKFRFSCPLFRIEGTYFSDTGMLLGKAEELEIKEDCQSLVAEISKEQYDFEVQFNQRKALVKLLAESLSTLTK